MPTARPGRVRDSGPLAWTIPVFFALLGLGVVFHVQLRSGLALAQPDHFDPRLIQYTLERNHRWFFTDRPVGERFWGPPVFFPEPRAGVLTESMLGLQPFYSPWRGLGVGLESAYQLATMGLLLACFATAYCLFRRGLRFSPLAASVAAFLFAFALPRSAQLSHTQLFAHYATPVALLGLLLAFGPEVSSRRRAAGVGLFFAALFVQLLGSFYLVWFLALAAGAGALVAALHPRLRRPAWQRFSVAWKTWLLAAVVTLSGAGVFLWPYAAARDRIPPALLGDFEDALPQLPSFVFGGWGSWESQALGIGRWWRIRDLPAPWEQALCPGLFTLVLAGYGFWRRRRAPLALVVAGATGVTLILVLSWPNGATLWPLVERLVPGAEAIRAPVRVGLLLLLPVGLGVAWAVDALARHRRGRPLLALALGLVVLEQGQTQIAYPKGTLTERARALAATLPPGCSAFLYTPLTPQHPTNMGFDQLDAMHASLEAEIPTLNGYSGYAPGDWWGRTGPFLLDLAAPAALPALAAELARLGAPPERLCWLRAAVESHRVVGGTVSWTTGTDAVASRGFGRSDLSGPLGVRIFSDGFESGDLSRWSASDDTGLAFDPESVGK